MSPTKKRSPEKESKNKRSNKDCEPNKSSTPPLKTNRPKESLTPSKRKHAPIKFDLDLEGKDNKDSNRRESPVQSKKRRSSSKDKESNMRDRSRDRDISHERREEKRKISISIRHAEAKKYENIPSSCKLIYTLCFYNNCGGKFMFYRQFPNATSLRKYVIMVLIYHDKVCYFHRIY